MAAKQHPPYSACTDPDCPRLACQAWRDGREDGRREGRDEGYEDGYQAAQNACQKERT